MIPGPNNPIRTPENRGSFFMVQRIFAADCHPERSEPTNEAWAETTSIGCDVGSQNPALSGAAGSVPDVCATEHTIVNRAFCILHFEL